MPANINSTKLAKQLLHPEYCHGLKGRVLVLVPATLEAGGGVCSCPGYEVEDEHFFVLLPGFPSSVVVPLYSNNDVRRHVVEQELKRGRQGSRWMCEPSHYHEGQWWTVANDVIVAAAANDFTIDAAEANYLLEARRALRKLGLYKKAAPK